MSQPETMRAWHYTHATGGLEKTLYLEESAPLPTATKPLGPTDVRVRVHYAALNPVDYKLPELPIVGRLAIPKPATPGLDYSGVIVEKGSDVKLEIGQEVFGKVEPKQPFGTLADYIIAAEAGTIPLPKGVTLEDAACVGVCGLVTYQCLSKVLKPGDSVFINGGSGGSGVFAIQHAKALGAFVTVTCSTPNVELCKSLGADEVIDYKTQDLVATLKKSGRMYDMILENVGYPPELYWACPEFTKPDAPYLQIGTHVTLSFLYDLAFRLLLPTWLGGGQRKFAFISTSTNYDDYMVLSKLMSEGKLKSVIEKTYPMEEVPQAYERLKSGRVRGKLVVNVIGDAKR